MSKMFIGVKNADAFNPSGEHIHLSKYLDVVFELGFMWSRKNPLSSTEIVIKPDNNPAIKLRATSTAKGNLTDRTQTGLFFIGKNLIGLGCPSYTASVATQEDRNFFQQKSNVAMSDNRSSQENAEFVS